MNLRTAILRFPLGLAFIMAPACGDDVIPSFDLDATTIDGIDAGFALDATVDGGPPPPPVDAGHLDSGMPDAGNVCIDSVVTATVTASTALANLDALDGQFIRLIGTATTSNVVCTDMACPVENPCCNECTADVRIDEILVVASVCTDNVGCQGTECLLVCAPPILSTEGSFEGILTKTSSGVPEFELF